MMLSVGTRLGPYEVIGLLGAGGMGEVYIAQDTKLNRPVAVKLLSSRHTDPAARRRFQREAEMASSLSHPHILTVYDAGEFDSHLYLVTEYVDGGTLNWAGREKRTWREIVELLLGVADGLASAHEANILHRDIKPANILISPGAATPNWRTSALRSCSKAPRRRQTKRSRWRKTRPVPARSSARSLICRRSRRQARR